MSFSVDFPVLRCWPTPLSEAVVTSFHAGFSGAEVWCVTVGTERFALRRWPIDALPPARLAGLHRVLADVSRRGFAEIAAPLRDRHGMTVVEFQRRLWQLEPWLPGTANYADEPSRAKLTSAISCLAHFHQLAADHRPEPQHSEWFASKSDSPAPAVMQRLELMEKWCKRRAEDVARRLEQRTSDRQLSAPLLEMLHIASRTLPSAIARLMPFASQTFQLQPCLRDLWHDHLLFEGDRLTGIIDPSACRVDHPVVDLARLFGSLFQPGNRADRDFALEIYRQHRPLSEHDVRLLNVLESQQALLSGLNWIDRLLDPQFRCADAARLSKHLTDLAGKVLGQA